MNILEMTGIRKDNTRTFFNISFQINGRYQNFPLNWHDHLQQWEQAFFAREIDTMIFLGLVFFALVAFLVFKDFSGRIRYIEDELRQIKRSLVQEDSSPPRATTPSPAKQPLPAPIPAPSSIPLSSAIEEIRETYRQEKKERSEKKKSFSFEQQFGARLPVWIGGIALALSGFYLVKYSIEKNLLTEEVRVALGAIFGIALIAAARYIREKKQDMADGTRIAQALCGAGIADLYATVFAATSLYHMLPQTLGFIGMAVVTALAVILSLRHGMPIALLGLMGGFITPGLIGSDHPSAVTLFIYLYCVLAGLFAVIRQKNWWVLSVPAILASFVWVLFWVFSRNFHPEDGLYLGLFILAVSFTVVRQSGKRIGAETAGAFTAPALLSYITFACALSLMALVTVKSGFGLLEWGFYGILGLGGIAMAYFKPSEYKLVPWASMALNIVMLALWPETDKQLFSMVLSAFALLYAGSGLFLSQKSASEAVSWAGLAAAAALGFYGVAYAELKGHFFIGSHVWGGIALALAVLFAHMTMRSFNKTDMAAKLHDELMAIFTLTATAFISICLTMEMDRDFLSVAFALQILATAWLYTKVDIPALRLAGKGLFVVFFVLVFKQLMLLASVAIYSLFGMKLHLWSGSSIPLLEWPLFQLGLPAVCMGAASWLFRQRRDGRFVETLETAAVLLGALTAYYMARKAFHIDENVIFIKAGFFERGMMTNLFFMTGLACIYFGRELSRRAIVMSGTLIFGMALFRVMWFDHFTLNPLWHSSQLVGDVFLLNSLLLPFGLPLLWLGLTEKPAFYPALRFNRTFKGILMFMFVFMFVTLNVRQLFHGTNLAAGPATNAEVYAYSIVWLLLGGGLLFLGTLREEKGIRVGSLVITLLTIGKVFLYDAGELTGLYRVFSFMGLGLALIGLSWFYSRFVFKKNSI